MKPPRILFVYQFLTLGGVEVVMQTRLKELSRRNIEARMLFLAQAGGGEAIFQKMGEQIAVLTQEAEIEKYLKDFNPDWISTIDTPAIIPIASRVVPNAKIAYEVHTPYPDYYALLLDRDLLNPLSGIIVPSPSQKEFMALRLARPLPIRVVANAIPEEFFQQTTLPSPAKRPIVMWVGRLDDLKNWRGFIELAAQVRERTEAEFWLVGGLRNQEEGNLFEAIKHAGLLDAFRWLPAVNYEDMPGLYSFVGQSGGCVVSTSWGESFGMAALEAMASRCPVVAPDIVGIRDLVKHGQTGWLYASMNLQLAGDFIVEALHNLAARQIIIENAQRMAKEFTPAASINQLLEIFSQWSANASPKSETLSLERKSLLDQLRERAQGQAAQLAEKERERQTLSAELTKTKDHLTAQVAEKEQEIEALSAELAQQREAIEALSSQASQAEKHSRSLLVHLATKEHFIEALSEQLSVKDNELRRITNSLGWRLLSRYGQIKYRYLLPVYKALGLPPYQKKSGSREQAHQLPFEPFSEAGETFDFSPQLSSSLATQALLEDLAQQMPAPSNACDVVCFSIIDWDFRFQRPQQIMSQFAEQGHRVFYINPTRFLPSDAAPRISVKQIKENIFEVRLAVEQSPDIFSEVIEGSHQAAILASLDELRRLFHIEEAIAFVMIASWTKVALATKQHWGWHTIYDCMDNWEDFPLIKKAVVEMEQRLVEQNDLMVVSAQRLYEKWRNCQRPMVLARNAVDYDFFAENCQPNTLLGKTEHPIIGYYGAISDWFDLDLLLYVARQRPAYTFVLLGGVFHVNIAELASLPNVELLGQQPYETMPQYLYHFDACIIPFKIDKVTEATDPVKLYEYLSAGKPVVSVALPEISIYDDYLYIAQNREEFLAKLDQAVREDDPEMVARRQALAAQNTWRHRYTQIQSGLAQALPRASLIIAIQNDLAHTKLCIESLLRNTAYPNYEVVIVAHGSDEDLQAYLQLLADQYDNFKIIFNATNKGRAQAINQGIAQSTGQYLVLLNSDALAPPGWLSRLLRHLQDRAVGAVLPLINVSGSPTASETPDNRLAEREAFATNYNLMNQGSLADIDLLTTVCLALRREVFDNLGQLDENANLHRFEGEYAQLVKSKGYRVVCVTDVFVQDFGRMALPLKAQLAGREESLKTLKTKLVELTQQARQFSSQLAENEAALQSVMEQLRGREQTLESSLKQAVGQRSATQSFPNQSVEKSLVRQALAVPMTAPEQALLQQIAEKEQEIQQLSSQASQAEQNVRSLSVHLATKEHFIEALSEQLSVKDNELRRITNSLGWRLLSRYGQIKYRYLLPVYKALGLPPYQKKSGSREQAHQLPFEPFSDAIQTSELSPELDSPTLTQALPEKVAPQGTTESNAYDVVCFPIIDWDFRFQRPQQLMSRFAAAGHRVFYISQNFYPSGPPYLIQEKQPNIFEVSLRGPEKVVYKDVLDETARHSFFDSLDALRRDLLLAATVAVVQLPFWLPLVKQAHSRFAWPIVYDCMDYHAGFSTNETSMIDQEHELLTSADLVVVSSNFLEQNARQHNANVLMVRNACDYEHFAQAEQASKQRPVIGYYGAIADWFDADLVADLAERRPDWDFLLVGSTFSADLRRLSKLANVSLPGEKPYTEIPDWLAKFDVAIIPFQRTPLTEATNPVKAYEILASGKPIVSVPIPEVAVLTPLVRLASTAQEFDQEISAALNENDPQLIEKRRAFAREHTWEKRYEVLAPAIREVFPKASIIIVTYNNLHLNRLCLESLYARMEWPNFEVIVIDNASADATPQYLLQAKATLPHLSVILNDENLGFAAANNVGLQQATGGYLVLLNNDTVLPRGWLSTLIRHLQADREIGIIGPVTNEIGNEAKVQIGYQQLAEMPGWAANFVRTNDSQLFAINVLAMFCVAMRSEVFAQIGLLDESFQVGMFEDDDYSRRVREKGYKVICARDSFIHHAGGASFKLLSNAKYMDIFQRNRRIYEEKWGLWEPHLDRKDQERIPDLRNRMRQIIKKSGVEASRIVVFLPSIGWSNSLVQRPHHLASELARQGFLVFFDCSGSLVDHFADFVQIKKNLWTYNGPKGVLDTLERPILWTLSYNVPLTERWENPTIVYDWIDDLSVFPYNQNWLQANHEKMLESADLILCVARNLLEQAREKRPDALYVQNGVEYTRFASQTNSIGLDFRFQEMVGEGRPIVGYYGAIASWFDVELLTEVAELRKDWSFVIIGHRLDDAPSLKGLEAKPNVLILAAQKYESLPNYLAQFAVATIPFKVNRITEATSPLKLYEYFAGGKPVISTQMPECQSYAEVRIVRDAQEFSRALDAARESNRDPKTKERLQSLGRENSWTMRVQTVEKGLQNNDRSNGRSNNKATPPSAPVMASSLEQSESMSVSVRPEEQNQPAPVRQSNLVGAAANLAERFHHFSNSQNQRFFEALCNHLSRLQDHPCLTMYFEFAITCNERGRMVANLLQKHTALRDKQYLDMGCAYAGFLVAFAEQGAKVTGIDSDQALLHLAKYNLMDNQLDVRLFARDATRAADFTKFHDSFDIITCNDVIEHVDDPQALVSNIAALLREEGLVYFEIPNRYYPRFVLQDGHFQLFGITLLDYPEAEQYYLLHAPGSTYNMRHYLGIEEYAKIFANAGLQLALLPETFEGVSIDLILNDVAELRANAESGLSKVPAPLRQRVSQQLSNYLEQVEAQPRDTKAQQRDFQLHYGAGFWRVLGRKTAAQADASAGNGELTFIPESEPELRASTVKQNLSTEVSGESVQGLPAAHLAHFEGMPWLSGRCNICGNPTQFFYSNEELYRESLTCCHCLSTSRYRSIARGILLAIRELTGIAAKSLAELDALVENVALKIYDTQTPLYFETCAYPIPDLLAKCKWIDLQTSLYRSEKPLGIKLGANLKNQNLEALTYADNRFDIVITSDVMEHVRLDDRAHQEISRVLKSGGIYLFTVPHFREWLQTFYHVVVHDPLDPTKDEYLTEKVYHGDANSEGSKALSYRAYGIDLDKALQHLGFTVEYDKTDYPEMGIMSTELYYCRLSK